MTTLLSADSSHRKVSSHNGRLVSQAWHKKHLIASAKAHGVALSYKGKTRTKAQLIAAIKYAASK
jgi:hypothetical protein